MIEEEQKLDLDLRHDDSDDLAEIVKEFCELRDNLLEAIAEAKRKLAKG
jgi:hypothetical protein